MSDKRLVKQVLAIGVAQTVAWASSIYLLAIIAHPLAADLGISRSQVFGALSLALVVMGMAGPAVGRLIDRNGGRGVLACSNVVIVGGLTMLGFASDTGLLYAAWCVLGVGMAMGLYDAAFATLVRLHGQSARGPITGITLIAGFASTVGWPLTALVAQHFGWRASCFAWATLHLCIALPINLIFIPSQADKARMPTADKPVATAAAVANSPRQTHDERHAFIMLTLFAAFTSFVTSAMAAHLPGLLMSAGAGAMTALAASALVGPAQVMSRLIEFLAMRHHSFHPLLSARIATALHPIGALIVATFGAMTVPASCLALLHGAGNGMITIAKGTLPLAIFGTGGYGYRQGQINVLAKAMQAAAPLAFGLVLETLGVRVALGLSAGLSLIALAALLVLRVRHNTTSG